MIARDLASKRALAAEVLRRKEQRARPIPLSAAQRRLWLLDRLEPGSAAYLVPLAFALVGPLDVAALRGALETVVRRHDVLRSRIVGDDGEPAYAVDPSFVPPLPLVDAVGDDDLARIVARESARPFDLRAEPPLRAQLVRVGAREHVLLIVVHHLAIDGWSTGIVLRELSAAYRALRGGDRVPLDLPRCTYADFAEWQRAQRTAGDYVTRLDRWRDRLARAPAPLAFTGPPAGSPGGSLRTRVLAPSVRDALRRAAQARRTTEFSVLFGLFALVLHRCSGSRDFIVGAPVAGRLRPAFEDVVGCFVNPLPLRVRIDGDPPLAAWFAELDRTLVAALDDADIPFDAVVEAVRPQRSAAQTPLLNVMFAFDTTPAARLNLADLVVRRIDPPRTTAKFDLTLEVGADDDGLRLGFEYRTTSFDATTIEAMLDVLESLARRLETPASGTVATVPLVSPPPAPEAPADRPPWTGRIETLFARQAAERPAALAVVDGTTTLTYAALDERAQRLARRLRAAGATGERVGLCLERGADAIVAMLGILAAGATYVPLDPAYPPQRLRYMVRDAGLVAIVADAAAGAVCAAFETPLLSPTPDGEEPVVPDALRDPAAAAYVMYTSGSTGTPKGVLVPHAGIERLARDPGYATFGAHDVIAHASPLCFDASTFEVWSALLNGARLVIVPPATLLAPPALRAFLDRHGVTVLFLTTALAREIVRGAPATLSGLRLLLVGGEALDEDTGRRLAAALPHGRAINGYGPTEATTFATFWPLDANAPPGPVPIGRPLRATRADVLDGGRQPLPPGITGELYLGGVGIALGYLGDPERTAARFVADPAGEGPDARRYATGDLARLRPDGALEYLGRRDGQLKRRGFRIEPGEIESALRDEPGIVEAAVVAQAETDGTRVVAFVVVAEPTGFDPAAVHARLRERLPAFMLPDRIAALATLPHTPTGKIDRLALAELRVLPAPAPAATAGPQDEGQAALRELWERLLGVAPIGIDDDFFALGGHSLLALRMLGEIERAFGVRLPPATLFARPTIAALAQAMCERAVDDERDPCITFHPDGTRRPFFFLHGSLGGGGFYCRALADAIGPQRPFHALRPHGTRTRPPLPSIEAMAADYVGLVRRRQPHGPYLLGGFCNGGLVAFEMARRLRELGEPVARLLLLDVPDTSPPIRRLTAALELVTARLPLDVHARRRVTGWVARLPHHRARRRAGTAAPPPASEHEARVAAWIPIVESYVARRYAGRTTLLLTHDEHLGGRGWPELCERLERRDVPGDHRTCLSESIGETARVFAELLADEP